MSDTKQQIIDKLDEGLRRRLNKLGHFDAEYNGLFLEFEEDLDEILDRLVTEARMNELEMLPHKVFECSPLIHLGYTFDEHTEHISELKAQLKENNV